jgi:prolyl oligopeptidase
MSITYPLTRYDDLVETHHGVQVPDPYRWLEDLDSAETKAWVTAENALTEKYLAQIPARERIRRRLTELWNFERYAGFYKEGGRYFYLRNDGLQNQNVLYTLPAVQGKSRVLLDPNTLSKDGTVALSGISVSHRGKLLAYAIGRSLDAQDQPAVRQIARNAAVQGYRWSSIITGIVTSTPFTMSTSQGR